MAGTWFLHWTVRPMRPVRGLYRPFLHVLLSAHRPCWAAVSGHYLSGSWWLCCVLTCDELTVWLRHKCDDCSPAFYPWSCTHGSSQYIFIKRNLYCHINYDNLQCRKNNILLKAFTSVTHNNCTNNNVNKFKTKTTTTIFHVTSRTLYGLNGGLHHR